MVEYANLNSLLRRLSIVQLEMKGLLHGKSLKERVQTMSQPIHDIVEDRMAASNTNPSKDVWLLDKGHGFKHQEEYSTEKYKHMQSSFKGCQMQDQHRARPQKNNEGETSGDQEAYQEAEIAATDCKERKKIVQLWRDYNCGLHLRRIIDSSRRGVACRMLEELQSRLTHHMQQYIGAVAKGLIGEEKAHYLRFFKHEGPFRSKPLREGTYAELLNFVGNHVKPAKDVLKALQIAEEELEEEAGREGYNPSSIGDIRAQMRAFLLVSNKHLGTHLPLQDDDDQEDITRDLLLDLSQAADQEKLGLLQPAHKLVKLACFFALKRIDSSFQAWN